MFTCFAAFNERKLGFKADSIPGFGNKWKSWSVSFIISGIFKIARGVQDRDLRRGEKEQVAL